MKQNYFNYKGNKILSGTILKFKPYCVDYFWKLYTDEVTFIWYEPDCGYYYIKIDNRYERMPKEKFENYFISPTTKQDTRFINTQKEKENMPAMSFMDELQIDGMFLAWLWFVFSMMVTFIFKGFYFYWAFIIAVFLYYRNYKIDKNKRKKRR